MQVLRVYANDGFISSLLDKLVSMLYERMVYLLPTVCKEDIDDAVLKELLNLLFQTEAALNIHR